MRRLSTDIDGGDPARTILGQNGCVSSGIRLENGFLYGQMGLMHCCDQAKMVLYRSGDHMDVGFQARTIHALWVPITGTAVKRKILWADLKHLAILFQANTCSQFHGIPQIVRLNVPPPAKLVKPSAVDSCNRSAHPDDRRLGRGLRSRFRLMQRKSYTLRQGRLVIQPPPAPGLARRLSKSQESQTLVFQSADHHAGACAPQVDTDCEL